MDRLSTALHTEMRNNDCLRDTRSELEEEVDRFHCDLSNLCSLTQARGSSECIGGNAIIFRI